MRPNLLDFKVLKVHRLPEGNNVRAFADLMINDVILIKGLRVVNSQKGLFVSMPQELGKNQRWYDKVRCLDRDLRHHIDAKVIEAYRNEE